MRSLFVLMRAILRMEHGLRLRQSELKALLRFAPEALELEKLDLAGRPIKDNPSVVQRLRVRYRGAGSQTW